MVMSPDDNVSKKHFQWFGICFFFFLFNLLNHKCSRRKKRPKITKRATSASLKWLLWWKWIYINIDQDVISANYCSTKKPESSAIDFKKPLLDCYTSHFLSWSHGWDMQISFWANSLILWLLNHYCTAGFLMLNSMAKFHCCIHTKLIVMVKPRIKLGFWICNTNINLSMRYYGICFKKF